MNPLVRRKVALLPRTKRRGMQRPSFASDKMMHKIISRGVRGRVEKLFIVPSTSWKEGNFSGKYHLSNGIRDLRRFLYGKKCTFAQHLSN